jgi:predicted transcriptional regulator
MNVQFVRLDDDVTETINQIALDRKQTVSDLVNEVVRKYLEEQKRGDARGASPR